MLKNKTKIIAILLMIFVLLSCSFVFADEEINTDNLAVTTTGTQDSEDSYKKSDVYLIDNEVTIDYIVDGNLFVMADTVTIKSQIGGDAFIMAKNIIVEEEGYIYSNLFALSNSITIKGIVYDVYTACNTLNIDKGYVYRDLKATADTININGTIGRNAFLGFENLNFNTNGEDSAVIYGDLNYSSKIETTVPDGIVKCSTNFTPIVLNESNVIVDYLYNLGQFIAALLIIWAVCLLLAPKFLENTNQYVGKKTLSVCGVGILSLILVPVAFLILVLLKITAGIAFTLLGLYCAALVISKSLFVIVANNYICSKLKIENKLGIFGMLVPTGVITWLLTKIPYVGAVISFIVVIIGFGVLTYAILPKRKEKNETSEESVVEVSDNKEDK